MKILYYYIDFLAKSFDIKSRASRKSFLITVAVNTALMILLVSVGLAVPQGRPLQLYIAISSIISTPLIPPYITMLIRRLNDVNKSRKYALLMLIPCGLGMIPLLIFCLRKSAFGTEDDLTKYESVGTAVSLLFSLIKNIQVVYPFVNLLYLIFKMISHSGIVGVNAALLSITFSICAATVLGMKKPRAQAALSYLGFLKKLTALSSTILTIAFYQNTQDFIEAIVIIYLYFNAMISPAFIAIDVFTLIRESKAKRVIQGKQVRKKKQEIQGKGDQGG